MILLAIFVVIDFIFFHIASRRQQALKLALGDQARASEFS
jgi:hypothetical protein